jgi:hypothetical protein
MYRVEFYKQAARYYEKLDAKIRRRINAAIENTAQNPFEGPHIKTTPHAMDATDARDAMWRQEKTPDPFSSLVNRFSSVDLTPAGRLSGLPAELV